VTIVSLTAFALVAPVAEVSLVAGGVDVLAMVVEDVFGDDVSAVVAVPVLGVLAVVDVVVPETSVLEVFVPGWRSQAASPRAERTMRDVRAMRFIKPPFGCVSY
jgi:hypothetical protein